MFEALSAKVFTAVASLSMFLFSSYTGNDPGLRNLNCRVGESYLQVRSSLVGAFENDFPDVFKSGIDIPVTFTVSVRSGNRTVAEHTYRNVVRYDLVNETYIIQISGMNRNLQTSSYAQMINEISSFECSIPYVRAWGKVTVKLEAKLSTVRFQQLKKPVDLMVLWKYQKPKVNTTVDLQKVS